MGKKKIAVVMAIIVVIAVAIALDFVGPMRGYIALPTGLLTNATTLKNTTTGTPAVQTQGTSSVTIIAERIVNKDVTTFPSEFKATLTERKRLRVEVTADAPVGFELWGYYGSHMEHKAGSLALRQKSYSYPVDIGTGEGGEYTFKLNADGAAKATVTVTAIADL